MNCEPIGQDRFAKFDPTISRIHGRHFEHVPSFETVLIHMLIKGDNEAANFAREHVESARLQSILRLTDHLMTVEEMRKA